MNNSEVLEKLRAYLKCQDNKVKGINAMCTHNMCDNCDLCYMQGTTGEHIEAIEVAIQALEKLQVYKNLEEQGRLVKLPCKVGDTIYGLHKAMVCELDTETIGISKMPSGEILYLIDGWELDKGDFGKTVFLTKSEAEAKLEELRGEENESSN